MDDLADRIKARYGDRFDTGDILDIGDTGFVLIYDHEGESYEMCLECLDVTNGIFDHTCPGR